MSVGDNDTNNGGNRPPPCIVAVFMKQAEANSKQAEANRLQGQANETNTEIQRVQAEDNRLQPEAHRDQTEANRLQSEANLTQGQANEHMSFILCQQYGNESTVVTPHHENHGNTQHPPPPSKSPSTSKGGRLLSSPPKVPREKLPSDMGFGIADPSASTKKAAKGGREGGENVSIFICLCYHLMLFFIFIDINSLHLRVLSLCI